MLSSNFVIIFLIIVIVCLLSTVCYINYIQNPYINNNYSSYSPIIERERKQSPLKVESKSKSEELLRKRSQTPTRKK
jgi:uncharacterized protein YpmB